MTELKMAAKAEDRFATCRGKLGVCTRRIHETKALLTEGGNIDDVDKSMHMFKRDEFNKVHNSVQELLSQEEKETDTLDWYEPRVMNFNYLTKEVNTWKREQSAQLKVDPLDSISNISRKTTASTTSSAARLASAVRAALEAKSAALKENIHCSCRKLSSNQKWKKWNWMQKLQRQMQNESTPKPKCNRVLW